MFGAKGVRKSAGVGIFSSSSGVALAVVEGVLDERPRVSRCDLYNSDENLAEIIGGAKLSRSRCVDVLPMREYNLIQVDLQGVKQDERREAARWQIHELIDFPAEEAVLDLIDVPVSGDEGKTVTYVVAAQRTYLRDRVSGLKNTQLQLEAIDIPEFSLRNLIELYPYDPRGHCFLWIREQSSLLIICRENTLFFSRTINFGMDQIEQRQNISKDDPGEGGLDALLDGIVLELQRSLDYCESNFRLPQVSKILLAMIGEKSDEILGYLDRFLSANVELFDLSQIFDLSVEMDPQVLNGCLPALGAALRAGGRL